MENKSAIAIVNDYPLQKFNLLIPMKTMQEISPMHKVVVNQVQINPDPNGKDVYKEKNGEFALSKKALAKLMAAANIQVVESTTVLTTKCKRCAEIASKTRIAPNCGTCPAADDIAHQVTLAVPEPSGTWRKVISTKEIRMADEKAKMSDAQYKMFFPFRSEQCESKALNRALREALMISSTYKTAELEKPFVVAYIVPNMNDPEMKKVAIEQYRSSTAMMFNGNKEVKQISSTIVVDADDEPDELQNDTPVLDAEVMTDETIPPWSTEELENPSNENENVITCEGCAEIIVASGGKWTVKDIQDYSKRTFKGKTFCPNCQQKAKAQAKSGNK